MSDEVSRRLQELLATAQPATSVPSGAGRGPSGKLRNFAQMSYTKLKFVVDEIELEGNDQEALDAAHAEMEARRGT